MTATLEGGDSNTPRPHFTHGKEPVPIVQEAGWASGPGWTSGKSRPHRDSIPDRPARSSVTIPTELPSPLIENYSTSKPLNVSPEKSQIFVTLLPQMSVASTKPPLYEAKQQVYKSVSTDIGA